MTPAAASRHLLVVSHPAALPVNQLPYLELQRNGWEVGLVVPASWRHDYRSAPFPPRRHPEWRGSFRPLPVLAAGRPLRHVHLASPGRVLRASGAQVLFVEAECFSAAALQWGRAAHRRGMPFGVQADENLDRPLPGPVRRARSWVLRHAAFVAARSERAAELVSRWGAIGAVEFVPHHVADWEPVPPEHSDRFRVGFAGRLVPEKGLDTLVDAVRRLGPGVDLVVAGAGPRQAWLEGRDLGPDHRLELLSDTPHDRMASVYARMDVLVLPSRTTRAWSEQFGRVLVEALSCGVPVVGSESGEIPWVIGTTGGGVLFPEGDAAELARQLEHLRSEPELGRRLADHGRRQVEEVFGVAAVAGALDRLLTRALSGSVPGRPPG